MNQPMELSNLKLNFGANDQGFTLLELLMATLVTTMVLITITPPLFLAVATRVQAQRMEQAVQFAQQNLELVRWVMNQNPSADQLPATVMEDVRQGLPHPLSHGVVAVDGFLVHHRRQSLLLMDNLLFKCFGTQVLVRPMAPSGVSGQESESIVLNLKHF